MKRMVKFEDTWIVASKIQALWINEERDPNGEISWRLMLLTDCNERFFNDYSSHEEALDKAEEIETMINELPPIGMNMKLPGMD